MSTYLLLRNNKESGPFTIEEMKEMSLQSYDLLWVVGKSASWRYPAEIAELKSFAPPLPEQPKDPVYKKYMPGNTTPEYSNGRLRDNNLQRIGRSVYVNLPVEKKQVAIFSENILPEISQIDHPEKGTFSDIYKKQSSASARYSGRILWISTIILLFGAGILTGLFISDRREFFSTEEKHPQPPAVRSAVSTNQKINAPVQTSYSQPVVEAIEPIVNKNSVSVVLPATKKPANIILKKRINQVKKDSSASQAAALASFTKDDSSKLNAVSKTDVLYQKIKAHPENYIDMAAGRYSTGILGGISSFAVTITNNSPVVMDEVIVKIDYIQSNDKIYKSESLAFNDLQPGETVSVKAPKSSRGTKISSSIHSIVSRKLDLNYSH
jgi:hypothetical protein